MSRSRQRRVVVTGLGCVSPVGNNVADSWATLVEGKSGIATITKFDATPFSTRFAGEVKGFNIEDYIPGKEARHMDTFIHYGMAAGIQAIADSGLAVTDENADRIGVIVGSGIGGLPMIEETHAELVNRGPRRISPFFVPASIINMISGHLSIKYGFKGPNLAIVTACTTGLHCIGAAARMIEYGDADVMIAGGAESTVSPLGVGGFAAARALSARNDDPATASRPWDKDRDGFVLGEGAGVMVLEEYEFAKARGAKIYAEVLGFGMSADAHHMTAPLEDGDGARRAGGDRRVLVAAQIPVQRDGGRADAVHGHQGGERRRQAALAVIVVVVVDGVHAAPAGADDGADVERGCHGLVDVVGAAERHLQRFARGDKGVLRERRQHLEDGFREAGVALAAVLHEAEEARVDLGVGEFGQLVADAVVHDRVPDLGNVFAQGGDGSVAGDDDSFGVH